VCSSDLYCNALPGCLEVRVVKNLMFSFLLLFASAVFAHAEDRDRFGRNEAYWRGRADEVRRKLKNSESQYETAQQQVKDCESRRGSSVYCSCYRNNVKRIEADIHRQKQILEDDLPEEARKADAMPGWVR
jgi:hypothetical protein